MSAPQPPPMFPKACKHKKVFETWKFMFTPMFPQAMKHEKPHKCGLETLLAIMRYAEQLHMLTT